MSDPQRDEPAARPSSGKLPSAFPTQVARLAGEDPPYHSGELPLWWRLGRTPRRSRRWVAGLAWCVTASLLMIALLRFVAHDGTVLLTWFNAFTLYLYLPAYFVLAYAAWTRRWWLAAASMAVVALHVAWVAPDFRPASPYVPPKWANGEAIPLRIFYANVRGSNERVDDMLAEARAANPDIIILVEMQRYWWHEMLRRRPLPDFPYGTNLPHRNVGDVGVFSRLPVRRMEEVIVEHRCTLVLNLRLEQSEPGRELRLIALHSPRPNFGRTDNYYIFWETILGVLAQRVGPEVVIGDFNATQHSRLYRQMLALGLRSAHEDRGRGYATTWPNGVRPVPPIRIDQAMLSPEVECVSITEGKGLGSDHKPLVLDLRVHLPAPAKTGD